MGLNVVAFIFDLEARELIVDGLYFLQECDVRSCFIQPFQHAREARLNRVHVKSCDFQNIVSQTEKARDAGHFLARIEGRYIENDAPHPHPDVAFGLLI